MSFLTDASRWRALTIRDAKANGRFVYSVKTTKCYCRPTCPGRLARRANVGFFTTPAEAEAAGYRACKRCKPQDMIVDDPQERAVNKACTLIEAALKEDDSKTFRLQDLAKSVGLTPRYFHKIFKDKMGMTPREYVKLHTEQKQPEPDNVPLAVDAQSSLEPLNLDDFDFNNLPSFDFDPSLSLDNAFVTDVPSQPIPAVFGQEIDVNIQSLPWSNTCSSDPLIPGLGNEHDKSALGWDAGFSNLPASVQSWNNMMPAITTLELDAALVLGEHELMDTLPGFSADLVPALHS